MRHNVIFKKSENRGGTRNLFLLQTGRMTRRPDARKFLGWPGKRNLARKPGIMIARNILKNKASFLNQYLCQKSVDFLCKVVHYVKFTKCETDFYCSPENIFGKVIVERKLVVGL